MGNRAVITWSDTKQPKTSSDLGIYVHWNGGIESIQAFLEYAEENGLPNPSHDEQYGLARMIQMIANYFGGFSSIGVGPLKELDCDNWNNGVFFCKGFKVVRRMYAPDREDVLSTDKDLDCIKDEIYMAQPSSYRQ